MKQPPATSLAARRYQLVLRLRTQRAAIAHELSGSAAGGGSFPRSLTLRLLTQHPDLAVRAAWGLFNLWRTRPTHKDLP